MRVQFYNNSLKDNVTPHKIILSFILKIKMLLVLCMLSLLDFIHLSNKLLTKLKYR